MTGAAGSRPGRKPIIGLVGGIGSGKSTVARLLAESGAAVIDADALNRDQLRHPDVIRTVVSWWGEKIRDATGALDRRRIAKKIFDDAAQRHRLEALLHPRIAAERDRLIAGYQRDDAVWGIVLDTPLLVEAGLDQRCAAVVFVDAADDIRRQRVQEHRGWDEAEWRRRENSQEALDKKRASADYVVTNNSTDLKELRNDVNSLLARLGAPGRIEAP